MAALHLGLDDDPRRAVPELLALLPEARGADNGILQIVLGELVRIHVSSGNLATARTFAEDLIQANVDDVIGRAHAYYRLGDVCTKLGDLQAARTAFQQVLGFGLSCDVQGAVADDLNRNAKRRLEELGE